MRQPRYYVGTCTGWALNPDFTGPNRRPSGKDAVPVVFTVHDRLTAHRTIAEYPPSDGIGMGRRATRAVREQRAHELAARLNARYEAWLAEDPERLRVAV